MKDLETNELLNLNETIAKDIFNDVTYPYEIIPKIKDYILNKQKELSLDDYYKYSEDIYIAKTAKIDERAIINGPTIIGENTEVRPSVYIRGSVIIGNDCVIGNSCEFKNAIVFNKCEIPHFNYVGDSIVGYKAHLGAGVILSNFKAGGSNVNIRYKDQVIKTDLRKFSAILGDYADIGCNSVLNPGTIIGKNTNVYPLSNIRGYIPGNKIYKNENNIVEKI